MSKYEDGLQARVDNFVRGYGHEIEFTAVEADLFLQLVRAGRRYAERQPVSEMANIIARLDALGAQGGGR